MGRRAHGFFLAAGTLRPSEGRALCPVPPIPESLADREFYFVLLYEQ